MTHSEKLLSRRVATIALGVIGAWLILLMAGLNIYVDHKLRSDLTNSLRVKAQAALSTVVVSGGEITAIHDAANDADLDNGVWVISRGSAVAPAGRRIAAPALVTAVADRPAGSIAAPGRQLLYVLPVVANRARIGSVVVLAGTDGTHHAVVLTLIGSLVVGMLLLIGVFVVLRVTVARALHPVADMTDQAAAWSIGDPGRRFGAQRFAELTSLAHTLDALLDRVAGVLRHERSVTGELSHELRTPLARIKAEADLIVDAKGRADPQAVAGIREGTARMERIIETLLTSARTATAANQGRCSVSAAIAEAIDPSHADLVPISVAVDPPDLHAGVDLQVCARIIAPIIDNATRFAESRIDIAASAIDGRVCIDISNDGPAFAPNGRGLGLPLARRLAHAADGDVRLTAEQPVSFRIDLPA